MKDLKSLVKKYWYSAAILLLFLIAVFLRVYRLENLPDAEYAKVIGGMLERLDESQGKEIIVSAKDKARLPDVVKEKGYVLSDETRDIDSGFVVKNGDIEYNYSFDAIIMVQKEEMQITAAKILF